MTKRELNKWIREFRQNKYTDRAKYEKRVREFADIVKADGDELAAAYADLNLVTLELRSNSLSQNAIKKLVSVLQVSENHNDYRLETECHNILGIVVSHFVDKIAGLEHFEKGYALAKKHHYLLYQSIAANNIGDVYSSLGEYDLALDYLRESYRLIIEMEKRDKAKKRGTSSLGVTRINVCFMNMAEVYYNKGNYEEAFRMLSCIDGIEEDKTKTFYYMGVVILKSLIFIKIGAMDEVSANIDKIISEAESTDEGLSNVEDYIGLADALIDANYYDKAKRLLDASERIISSLNIDEKWCKFYKTKIKYLKVAEPDKDRTELYELYLMHRDEVDANVKGQQLTSLRNKKRLEEEIRRRSKAEEKNRLLKAMSEHDQLTGVYNRYAMNEVGSSWFNEAKEKNTRISFMIIDIDYFKEYNDTYGHLGGDEVLRTIGGVLIDCTQPTDLVIRYGGDEFFIISKGRTDEEIISLGAAINNAINEKQIRHSASPISEYVTLSFGAVCGKVVKNQTLIDAIHLADNGLYRIKNETRNALGLYRQVDDDFEFECVRFE